MRFIAFIVVTFFWPQFLLRPQKSWFFQLSTATGISHMIAHYAPIHSGNTGRTRSLNGDAKANQVTE